MADEILLVLSTFPDAETASRIAEQLVTEHFVACANILPSEQSIYEWQGKLEKSDETLVFFKTTSARWPELQAKLKTIHPYEVPEIVAMRISDGLHEYLRWVSGNCSPA
jgi:periplasmic divalent cation tolerance protein